jgi:hypothetical protein
LSVSIAANEEAKVMNKDETMVLETMTTAFNTKDISNVLTSYEDGAG